jgi:hypothetical protein
MDEREIKDYLRCILRRKKRKRASVKKKNSSFSIGKIIVFKLDLVHDIGFRF